MAMDSDGAIWSWGMNQYGQIAAPSNQLAVLSPAKWISFSPWETFAAGGRHGMAVRQNGTMWTWGYNNAGQLGTGAAVGTSFGPVAQESTRATNWVAALGKGDTSIGLKADGGVWGWGNNSSGQLGLGDTTTRTAPVSLKWSSSPPLIELSGPQSVSSPAPGGGTVTLTANVVGGGITKVDFYEGNTLRATDTTSPFTYTRTGLQPGTYSFWARATNGLGQTAVTPAFSVGAATLSVLTQTPPSSVSFTSEGTVDWLQMGLNTAASVDRKNVSTHVISDYIYQQGKGSGVFARDPSSTVSINWTDGAPDVRPHSNGTPTTAGVRASQPQAGDYLRVVAEAPNATRRVLSAYFKLVNADVSISTYVGGQSVESTWTNPSSTPVYRVFRVTFAGETAGDRLGLQHYISRLGTGGNLTFLGATVRPY